MVYFGNEGWGFTGTEQAAKYADFFCACKWRHHICHNHNVRVQMVDSFIYFFLKKERLNESYVSKMANVVAADCGRKVLWL